jgi:hypothetical protein
MKTGTDIFLVGTLGLTLPSLLSIYHDRLNIPPILPADVISEHGFFRYSMPFRILSPPSTLITHTFHHANVG